MNLTLQTYLEIYSSKLTRALAYGLLDRYNLMIKFELPN